MISSFGGVAQEKVHPDCDEEGETVALYTVFQLTIEVCNYHAYNVMVKSVYHIEYRIALNF